MSRAVILTTLHHNFAKKYQELAKCLTEYFDVIIATDEYPSYVLNRKSFHNYGINFVHTSSNIFSDNNLYFEDVLTEIFIKNEKYIMQCDVDRFKYYGACSLALANKLIWLKNNLNFVAYLFKSDIEYFISEGPNGALERFVYLCHELLGGKFELITYKRGKVGDTWIIGFGQEGYNALKIDNNNHSHQECNDSIVPLYAGPSSPLRKGLIKRLLNLHRGDTYNSVKYILTSIISLRRDSLPQAWTHLNMVTFGVVRDFYRWIGKVQLRFKQKGMVTQYWVFPEQYHPEAATSAIRLELADELSVLNKLATMGLELKYKPHPSCLGRNGLFWYSKITIGVLGPNVKPAKDRLCIGCIAINSTLILDFLIEGKPVICVGDNELIRLFEEFICRIDLFDTLSSEEKKLKIKKYLLERERCDRGIVFERLNSISLTNKQISNELKRRLLA